MGPIEWIVLVAGLAAIVLGIRALFRSLRRWQPPPPTSPEAKQAEARLWATRTGDQR